MSQSQSQQETGRIIQQWFVEFLKQKEEVFEELNTDNNRIEKMNRYKYRHQGEIMLAEERRTLEVDAEDLRNHNQQYFEGIVQEFNKYEQFLQRGVQEFIAFLCENQDQNNNQYNLQPEDISNSQYYVSFYNFTQLEKKLRKLKTDSIGQLVTFTGTITRATDVRPELITGVFMCIVCNSIVKDVEQQYKYTEPTQCSEKRCSNKNQWKLLAGRSIFTDMQKLRVQENSSDIPPGGMPRSIDVILRDGVCDRVKPGDKAKITGSLVVIPDIQSLTKPGEKNVMVSKGDAVKTQNNTDGITGLKQLGVRDLSYKMAFIGVGITQSLDFTRSDVKQDTSSTNQYGEEEEQNYSIEDIQNHFSSAELEKIGQMKQNNNIYENLAQSIAPTISGSESIKKGILLMLFGGTHKKTYEGINLRGDLNVCIVGDPSTAKSQLLKFVNNFLPRSVYTSGKASTAAGLTASVSRDPETGEYCVEAGALMLADHGVCCIDEFDKMGVSDQVAIHEAMEQQTISIAKAGIQATLNARASILAAANPIMGRYDKSKTLKQNLDMSAPIMSRFDLFFVVLDQQDQNRDKTVANYILKLHQSGEDSLRDNYVYTKEEMQLYLKCARYIKPIMTKKANEKLRQCYIELRNNDLSSVSSAYKITVRQLESLIRLSEALARVHLNPFIEVSYVEEAFHLLNQSIIKIEKPDQELDTVLDNQIDEEDEQQGEYQQNTNIVQEALKKKERMEQQQKNKLKITYDQYTRMMEEIRQKLVQVDQDNTEYNEEHEKEDDFTFRNGMRQQDVVEWYVQLHLDDIDMEGKEGESAIKEYVDLCHAVLQKMILNEQTVRIVIEHTDYRERYINIAN